MIRLKLNEAMHNAYTNANKLSKATGIRYPTIQDMANNDSKAWSPENLNKIMNALGLSDISQLIEYVPDNEIKKNESEGNE